MAPALGLPDPDHGGHLGTGKFGILGEEEGQSGFVDQFDRTLDQQIDLGRDKGVGFDEGDLGADHRTGDRLVERSADFGIAVIRAVVLFLSVCGHVPWPPAKRSWYPDEGH